jgi:hypothetical protein
MGRPEFAASFSVLFAPLHHKGREVPAGTPRPFHTQIPVRACSITRVEVGCKQLIRQPSLEEGSSAEASLLNTVFSC